MATADLRPLLDHPRLRAASRVAGGQRALIIDLLILTACGAAAATMLVMVDIHQISALFGMRWRIPGHSILKGTFPIALGLALVPRRFSGLTLSGAAAATLFAFRYFPAFEVRGAGATTSLLLLGPMLDLLLWSAKPGANMYARFLFAGLLTNLMAFGVRWGGKWAFDSIDVTPIESWQSTAPLSFAACGVAAGLLSSLVLFRSRTPPSPSRAAGAA